MKCKNCEHFELLHEDIGIGNCNALLSMVDLEYGCNIESNGRMEQIAEREPSSWGVPNC